MEENKKHYFYGNEISEEGVRQGYVDYRTLAKSFQCILCNNIIAETVGIIGDWETENGLEYYYEDSCGNRYTYDEKEELVEKLEDKISILEDVVSNHENSEEKNERITERIKELKYEIDYLEDEKYNEIFQYFIIDANGVDILERWTDEIIFYNEKLDIYVWGVTHYGTSWDYVMTNINIKDFESR